MNGKFFKSVQSAASKSLWDENYDSIEWKHAYEYLPNDEGESISYSTIKGKKRNKRPIAKFVYIAGVAIMLFGIFFFVPGARTFAIEVIWRIRELFNPATQEMVIEYTPNYFSNITAAPSSDHESASEMNRDKMYDSYASISEDLPYFVGMRNADRSFEMGKWNAEGILECVYRYDDIRIVTLQTNALHGGSISYNYQGKAQIETTEIGDFYYVYTDKTLQGSALIDDIELVITIENLSQSQISGVIDMFEIVGK